MTNSGFFHIQQNRTPIMINIKDKIDLIKCGIITDLILINIPDLVSYKDENGKYQPVLILTYLYNKISGVFAECICELVLDGVQFVSNMSYDRHNLQKFKTEIDIMNANIDISATGMNYDEFRDVVGVGKYCFMRIKKMHLLDPCLNLNDFYLGVGKFGFYMPNRHSEKECNAPKQWYYVLKKTDVDFMS